MHFQSHLNNIIGKYILLDNHTQFPSEMELSFSLPETFNKLLKCSITLRKTLSYWLNVVFDTPKMEIVKSHSVRRAKKYQGE